MPWFSSQFDQAVEKATSEMNTTEDYQTIFEICDKIQVTPDGPKQAIKAIQKRLTSSVPLHVMHALTLLDCCIKNCGRKFHLEVCSRDFESEVKKLLNKGHAKCVEKLKELLKRWTDEEFKNDPELSLIPSLYNSIKNEATPDIKSENSHQRERHKDAITNVRKEEDDLAKAIELSLKECKASTLYPNASSASNPVKTKTKEEARKVRAIYDFTAAEENELSFKAGHIITILDDSDPSWLFGSNQNNETGLFPANFVTSDLSEAIPPGKIEKTVKFHDEVKVKTLETPVEEVVIDENKIDSLLAGFLDADPTGQHPDNDDLLALEDHCMAMGPLIERQLEKIDHEHAEVTQCNKLLVDALKSYETLMKSYPSVPYGAPYQVAPEVMHSYPHPSAQPQLQPQVYNTHLQHHPGEPYQPMAVLAGHEHYPVPLSGALPTTLQSRNAQAVPPQLPYDTSNLNSFGTIPHHHSIPATSNNYSMPLPSRDANGLYYGDLVANSMQHSTTPISMHQPML